MFCHWTLLCWHKRTVKSKFLILLSNFSQPFPPLFRHLWLSIKHPYRSIHSGQKKHSKKRAVFTPHSGGAIVSDVLFLSPIETPLPLPPPNTPQPTLLPQFPALKPAPTSSPAAFRLVWWPSALGRFAATRLLNRSELKLRLVIWRIDCRLSSPAVATGASRLTVCPATRWG